MDENRLYTMVDNSQSNTCNYMNNLLQFKNEIIYLSNYVDRLIQSIDYILSIHTSNTY